MTDTYSSITGYQFQQEAAGVRRDKPTVRYSRPTYLSTIKERGLLCMRHEAVNGASGFYNILTITCTCTSEALIKLSDVSRQIQEYIPKLSLHK
jgi:hypothetical protein